MDINEVLCSLLETAEMILDREDDENTLEELVMAERIMTLHGWLTKGGFLPDDWAKAQRS